MSIFVRARFDVRDGRGEEFAEAVGGLREQARDEPGTLTFRFFAVGRGSCLVLEEYADAAAALAHNRRGGKLLERVNDCAEMAFIELYGDIGPELAEMARTQPRVTAFPDLP
jgi:quinol monooxygenase YgiN